MADAEHYAREGYAVSAGQSEATATHLRDLTPVSGFANQFVPGGKPPAEGDILRQPALADTLGKLAAQISPSRARDAHPGIGPADTVWLGCIDGDGRAVSLIQSIYWPFGSGVVLPGTGVLWQNRGVAFSLDEGTLRSLAPGRRPFHTLNPALAHLDDGRLMVYGCMGGEGQPQTQAAVFTRHAVFGQPLQPAIDAPRWVWGRTWGESKTALRMETRFDPHLIEDLRRAGHRVELTRGFDSAMGHAGALVLHRSGVIEGASDPRSDGSAAGF